MRLKISWLINWSTLSIKSFPLGLSAWRKVWFSWWMRILPRKLGLNRAEKWKRRPQLHQESDQIFFQPLHLHPHIGGPNNSAWGDVGSHKVMGMSVDRWKIMGMNVGSKLKLGGSIKKPRPERGGERVFLGFQGAGKLALAETKQFENFPRLFKWQLRIVIWWSGVKPKYCLSKCCLESCHPIYHPSSRTKSCIKFTICSLFKFCTQCKF